jgi:hypothetical protein
MIIIIGMELNINNRFFDDVLATICVLANPIGVAFGFLLPPMIAYKDERVLFLLLIEAIICSVFGILGIIFLREEPPTPPSSSKEAAEDVEAPAFFPTLFHLFSNINFIILFFVFGLALGGFNTLATVMPQVLIPFDYSDVSLLHHEKKIYLSLSFLFHFNNMLFINWSLDLFSFHVCHDNRMIVALLEPY